MRRKLLLAATAPVLLVGGAVLFPRQGRLPLEVVVRLLFGWCSYLARVLPRLTIAWDGVVTALACLVLFTVGLHGFLSWFHAEARRQAGTSEGESRGWSRRRTLSVVAVVLVMFVAGISAAGVVHQVGWLLTDKRPRTVLRPDPWPLGSRSDSTRNLSEMGLAAAWFQSVYTDLPATKYDGQGRALHSWQTALLPYLEAGRTSGQIDFDRPWDDPGNSAYFRGIVPAYLNPEIVPIRSSQGYALSHYAGNPHVLGRRSPLPRSEVGDGGSNTILAGEVASGFKPWGDPTNLRDPMRGINGTPEGFGNPSGTGANFLFLDGSVKFARSTTSPTVLQRLSLPSRPPERGEPNGVVGSR